MTSIAAPSPFPAYVSPQYSRFSRGTRSTSFARHGRDKERGALPIDFSSIALMPNAFSLAAVKPEITKSTICLARENAPYGLPTSRRPSPRSLWVATENSTPLSPTAVPEDGHGSHNYK